MVGILLDTHALFWLVSGETVLSDQALIAIGKAQESGNIFVSPISAWELAVATQKSRMDGRPNLGSDPPQRWFRDAVRAISAKVAPIRQRISCAAAEVTAITGHKDPGDCFLIATARVNRLGLVTRDDAICGFADKDPTFLTVIRC